MKPPCYTVHQVNGYIKRLMDGDAVLESLFIEGELSNFKEHSTGHLYFTLKDQRSAIQGVMFKSHAQSLNFKPENGLKVVAFGRVSVYDKTGAYQLYAELMQPLGLGGLYLAFDRLKNKLADEGLFDDSRKKMLPPFPKVIGVVTSPTGAAIRDIITVAARRNPGVRILIAPAAVQGENAAPQIAEAIGLLNTRSDVDIIILGRGGGSIEDLWAFNEEATARAVAASRIPIVSAVGHETDFTICDFAADLRAPTPSAAAELCVPSVHALRELLLTYAVGLTKDINAALDASHAKLNRLITDLKTPEALVQTRLATLTGLNSRLTREIRHRLRLLEDRTAGAMQTLNLASPLNVLKRGYAILSSGGNTIRSSAALSPGDDLTIKLHDGTITANVTSVGRDAHDASPPAQKETQWL